MSRRGDIELREQHALLDDLQALQALLSNGEATDNPAEPPLLNDVVPDLVAPTVQASAIPLDESNAATANTATANTATANTATANTVTANTLSRDAVNGDTVDWARCVDEVFAAHARPNPLPEQHQESRQEVAVAVLLQAMTVRLDARLSNLRASMLQLMQAELAHVLRTPTQTREP